MRLRGAAGLAESCENFANMWELVRFICVGDWKIDEVEKTEMMGSTAAFERVVSVELCWSVPWTSHDALDISILSAASTHKIVCIPAEFPARKAGRQTWIGVNIGRGRRQHRRKPIKGREEPIQPVLVDT